MVISSSYPSVLPIGSQVRVAESYAIAVAPGARMRPGGEPPLITLTAPVEPPPKGSPDTASAFVLIFIF